MELFPKLTTAIINYSLREIHNLLLYWNFTAIGIVQNNVKAPSNTKETFF